MEFDKEKCPVVDVDVVISSGKQYDINITLPEDNRSVIYGVIKDSYGEPIKDAVVKLIEVEKDCGKEERKPVSHTFTDEDGEFFLVLCVLINFIRYKFGLIRLNIRKYVKNAIIKVDV